MSLSGGFSVLLNNCTGLFFWHCFVDFFFFFFFTAVYDVLVLI